MRRLVVQPIAPARLPKHPLCDIYPPKLPESAYFNTAVKISRTKEMRTIVKKLADCLKGELRDDDVDINRVKGIMESSPETSEAFHSYLCYAMKSPLKSPALMYYVLETYAAAISSQKTDYEKAISEGFQQSDVHLLKQWALKLYPFARIYVSDFKEKEKMPGLPALQ